MMARLQALFELLDTGFLLRSAALVWMMWLTTLATRWSIAFAGETILLGTEAALVIGAVMAPVTLLQGAMFKWYVDARRPA